MTTKRTTTITVDLGELKVSWLAWCQQQQQMTPSHALRQVLRQAMDQTSRQASPPRKRVLQRRERATTRIKLNVTPSEFVALRTFARHEGYVPTKWVVAMIRTRLTGAPHVGQAEFGRTDPLESTTPRLGKEPEPDCESLECVSARSDGVSA